MPPVPSYRLPVTGWRRGWVARRLVIEPERARSFDAGEWARSLMIVERGALELEWRDGACLRFGTGDTLCLQGLGLSTLRAVGNRPTLLLILRR